MDSFGKALGARTRASFEEYQPEAYEELAGVFAGPAWAIVGHAEAYTEENVDNIWKNELKGPVRSALEQAGGGRDSFRNWLGEVHYVYVAAYLRSLFDHYQDNRGWRVLALSVPAVDVAVLGIASHYQQGQKHNRLGEVSNLLYDHATTALAGEGVSLPGRKITSEDWDGTGLMRLPPREIAGVQLPAGEECRLKYTRTTTVKKILASFIDVNPLDLSSPHLGDELGEVAADVEKAARALA